MATEQVGPMMSSSQPNASVFYQPDNLGALPHLWLQAELTISLTSMQEKFARLFMSIASELWLRGVIEKVEEVFAHAARSFTLRLAETLSQYICSLTRRAESLPQTHWGRPGYWYYGLIGVVSGELGQQDCAMFLRRSWR